MIFVTTGTILIPFKRLVRLMASYSARTDEKVVIQSGSCNISLERVNLIISPFFSNQEMIFFYKKARMVIAAAGEGSILQILQYSRNQPVLFPRLTKYNEHVDNQQVLIAKEIQKQNLGKLVFNRNQLVSLLQERPNINRKLNRIMSPNIELIKLLNNSTS
jgi:beta-1,4-N-acetylglucosaminyltransferase